MKEEKDILDFLEPKEVEIPDESYFESLTQATIRKSHQEKVIPMYKQPLTWLASAAAIGLILILSNLYFEEANSASQLTMSSVSQSEIENYIEENIEDFELTSFVSLVNTDALEDLSSDITFDVKVTDTSSSDNLSLEEISAEEIINYLDEESIELDELDEFESFI